MATAKPRIGKLTKPQASTRERYGGAPETRKLMKQAASDLEEGLEDTDCRNDRTPPAPKAKAARRRGR